MGPLPTLPYCVLGVDPGSVSGFGLLLVTGPGLPQLICHGQVRGGGLEIGRALEGAAVAATRTGSEVVLMACEQQYVQDSRAMDKRKRMGLQRSALSVAASRGGWCAMGEYMGMLVLPQVHPTTWREAVLGRGWGSKPRAQAKKQAVAVAAGVWGIKLKASEDHTAEAMLIASYNVTELEMKRRTSCADTKEDTNLRLFGEPSGEG